MSQQAANVPKNLHKCDKPYIYRKSAGLASNQLNNILLGNCKSSAELSTRTT